MLQYKNIFSVTDNYDVFLFDLWGVVIEGDKLYPSVVDAINRLSSDKKKQVFFVSNAPRSNADSYKRLKSWGINTSEEMIATSGEITRQILSQSKERLNIEKPIIYHLGSDRNEDIIRNMPVQVTDNIQDANILLLSLYRDEGENLSEFDELFGIVKEKNILTICANPDVIIPKLGVYRYCSGYFAQRLEDMGVKILYMGKPHTEIYDYVVSKIPSVPKKRILMIGDTFETDILGANRFGIDSALVLTGNSLKFHQSYDNLQDKLYNLAIIATNCGIKPNFVIEIA